MPRQQEKNQALFRASETGDVAETERLLSQGASVHSKDGDNDTPLHAASRHGQGGVVAKLVEAKADVNAKNKDNDTPLHAASRHGQDGVVAKLVEAKADVNAKNKDNDTPLDEAFIMVQGGVVAKLVEARADVNAKNEFGRIPLISAIVAGGKDFAMVLVEAKADVNAKDIDNDTPLHAASRHGQDGVVAKLVEAKADVNAKNKDNDTPLHAASRHGQDGVVAKLVEAKADVNAKNKDNDTPLHAASRHGLDALLDAFRQDWASDIPWSWEDLMSSDVHELQAGALDRSSFHQFFTPCNDGDMEKKRRAAQELQEKEGKQSKKSRDNEQDVSEFDEVTQVLEQHAGKRRTGMPPSEIDEVHCDHEKVFHVSLTEDAGLAGPSRNDTDKGKKRRAAEELQEEEKKQGKKSRDNKQDVSELDEVVVDWPVASSQDFVFASAASAGSSRIDGRDCIKFVFEAAGEAVFVCFPSAEVKDKYGPSLTLERMSSDCEAYRSANQTADLLSPVFLISTGQGNAVEGGVQLVFDVPCRAGFGSPCFIKSVQHEGDKFEWEVVDGGHFELVEGGRRLIGSVFTSSFSFWTMGCCKVRVATHCIWNSSGQDKSICVDHFLVPGDRHVPIPRVPAVYKSLHSEEEKCKHLAECSKGFTWLKNGGKGYLVLKDGNHVNLSLVKYKSTSTVVGKPEKQEVQWRHEMGQRIPDPVELPKDIPPEPKDLNSWLRVRIKTKSEQETFFGPFAVDPAETQKGVFEYFPEWSGNSICEFQELGRPPCGKSLWMFFRHHCRFCGGIFCTSHSKWCSRDGTGTWFCNDCARLLSLVDSACIIQEPLASSSQQQSEVNEKQDKGNKLCFFNCKINTSIDTNGEAQRILDVWGTGDTVFHPKPSKSRVLETVHQCDNNGVRLLHFAGHGEDSRGIVFEAEEAGVSRGPEPFDTDRIVEIVERQESVVCVFLNACDTLRWGMKFHRKNAAPYTICWDGRVSDKLALMFAEKFYKSLKDSKGGFACGSAFWYACTVMEEFRPKTTMHGVPCILWRDMEYDQKFLRKHGEGGEDKMRRWEQGHMMPVMLGRELASVPSPCHYTCHSDDEADDFFERSWRPPGQYLDARTQEVKSRNASQDFSALAGSEERKCLEALGIKMEYCGVSIGEIGNRSWTLSPWNGLDVRGNLHPSVLAALGLGTRYTGLWGNCGQVSHMSKTSQFSTITVQQCRAAASCLERAVQHREAENMRHRTYQPPSQRPHSPLCRLKTSCKRCFLHVPLCEPWTRCLICSHVRQLEEVKDTLDQLNLRISSHTDTLATDVQALSTT